MFTAVNRVTAQPLASLTVADLIQSAPRYMRPLREKTKDVELSGDAWLGTSNTPPVILYVCPGKERRLLTGGGASIGETAAAPGKYATFRTPPGLRSPKASAYLSTARRPLNTSAVLPPGAVRAENRHCVIGCRLATCLPLLRSRTS